MKKIIILSLMAIQTLFCFSETIVSEYYATETKFNIEADYNKHNVLKVYIEIYAGDDYVKYLGLDNEEEVENFRNNILLIIEKFNEWSSTAKTNNVSDFVKDFPITFKSVNVIWKSYSSGDYNFAYDQIIPILFWVNEEQEHKIAIQKRDITSADNRYTKCNIFTLFSSIEELKSLYNALDLDKIKNKLNNKTNVDDLFN
jgi:hypothetical protein